jgi:DinB superfamily
MLVESQAQGRSFRKAKEILIAGPTISVGHYARSHRQCRQMTQSLIRTSVLTNLDFRWNALIRNRLEGMSDDEYLWEPVIGCLSVRPDAGGGYALDPVGPTEFPLGNIAWRMAHLASSLSNHPVAAVAFGGAWPKPELAAPAGTAADATSRLDGAYSHWHATVASLSDADLARRLGSAAGHYAESTVLDLILHIQAEALQRGADLCLLRDLYWHLHLGGSERPG